MKNQDNESIDDILKRINETLRLSDERLYIFSNALFDIARETGVPFEDVSKGAVELASQKLDGDILIKRLKDALLLSRLTGFCTTKSVNEITRAVHHFRLPKYGYVSIRENEYRSNDWSVMVNGHSHTHLIQCADDIQGWYEHIKREKCSDGFEHTKTYHVDAPIQIFYHGDNPNIKPI